MRGGWLRRPARPAGLVMCLAACGCGPVGNTWPLVVPEQRHLDIHDPPHLPPAAIPQVPPPQTVATPAPPGDPKELSLDEAIRTALANARVVRVLAGVTAVASGQTVYDPAISNTAIDEARAVFDPVVAVNNAFSRSEV